jgi:hypothetical protein
MMRKIVTREKINKEKDRKWEWEIVERREAGVQERKAEEGNKREERK